LLSGFFFALFFLIRIKYKLTQPKRFSGLSLGKKFVWFVDTRLKVFIIVELSRAVALPLFKNINQNNLCGC